MEIKNRSKIGKFDSFAKDWSRGTTNFTIVVKIRIPEICHCEPRALV